MLLINITKVFAHLVAVLGHEGLHGGGGVEEPGELRVHAAEEGGEVGPLLRRGGQAAAQLGLEAHHLVPPLVRGQVTVGLRLRCVQRVRI